jgi:hypothetical protein
MLVLASIILTPGTLHAASSADAWTLWTARDAASTEQIDHSLWQGFLDNYLVVENEGVNRVKYLAAGQGQGRGVLQTYLRQLTSIDPRRLNANEQFAYWVNLYNALTVDIVLKYPSKKSIRRMGAGLFSFGPWDDKLITIAGHEVTLNDIEHRILRPIWQDPRIHFAVNCASIGCPNLQPEAFRADNLQRLLDQAQLAYINHPRGVDIQAEKLVLSSIFDWYQSDFAADPTALLTYLAQFHENPTALLAKPAADIRYEYDWTLNSSTQR